MEVSKYLVAEEAGLGLLHEGLGGGHLVKAVLCSQQSGTLNK